MLHMRVKIQENKDWNRGGKDASGVFFPVKIQENKDWNFPLCDIRFLLCIC